MNSLFIRGTVLILMNLAAGMSYCYYVQHGRAPEQWESVGALYFIGEGERHETVFLGSSRSHMFTRCSGVAGRVEHALDRPILNLSVPGNGVLPAKIYLEHFYERGNRAQDVVYFADAPFFLSAVTNEGIPRIEDQPFSFSFLLRCAQNGVEGTRLLEYVRSKFRLTWLLYRPMGDRCGRQVPRNAHPYIQRETERRNNILYHEGLQPKRLSQYVGVLKEMAMMAREHNAQFHIVVLPTLLTNEPGKKTLIEWLQPLIEETGSEFHDLSNEMREPQYFVNADHMNERGAAHIARLYLKPILENREVHASNST